ncbi:hypothetical protein ANN_20811 [Periplaneta americana]|uniref:Uncharacterized protein n=1 Tax=Periplaneta americana TaxID=6978 RepID=A0ABQ8SER6_PERAM|nr:hypothetical protein ANN_20811 [Periplaneta americana]
MRPTSIIQLSAMLQEKCGRISVDILHKLVDKVAAVIATRVSRHGNVRKRKKSSPHVPTTVSKQNTTQCLFDFISALETMGLFVHGALVEDLHRQPFSIDDYTKLKGKGHVARIGESRNAYRVLVGRPEGKRPLERPRHRWEDNIKMDLSEEGYDDRDWINLAQARLGTQTLPFYLPKRASNVTAAFSIAFLVIHALPAKPHSHVHVVASRQCNLWLWQTGEDDSESPGFTNRIPLTMGAHPDRKAGRFGGLKVAAPPLITFSDGPVSHSEDISRYLKSSQQPD